MWAKIKRWFYKLIGRKSKEDEVFGLEVFDENGDKTLSVTDRTAILNSVRTVDITGVGDRVFNFDGEGSRVFILSVTSSQAGLPPNIYVDGNRLTANANGGNHTIRVGIIL